MIFTNFLFFIVAIGIFVTAPASDGGIFSPILNIYGILILSLVFWNYNRYKFMQLRAKVQQGALTIEDAKKRFSGRINLHSSFALFIFAIEVYAFDLGKLVGSVPWFGDLDTFVNTVGLGVFVFYLGIVWYWSYRAMGDTLAMGTSARDHVRGNFRFNLPLVIPFLGFMVIQDILTAINPELWSKLETSPLFGMVFFGLYLFAIYIFAPVLITRLWDCRPLEPSGTRDMIEEFCRTQGVKFKNIMSWNAMNGTLVTAGVIGLVYPYRYLMITPELMRILDRDELLGVVSHEVGHVKKKHLYYYMFLFLGIAILGGGLAEWLTILQLYYILPAPLMTQDVLNYLGIFNLLLLLLVYFRFVFGYFMRNFERQADMYCFECGVDPNALIGSFMKLGVHLGDDGKKANWHHYNITQRINFLRKCMADPREIPRHNHKIRRSLLGFVPILLLMSLTSFYSPTGFIYNINKSAVMDQLQVDPDNAVLYFRLGDLSYSYGRYQEAKDAYEKSLELDYNQAQALNNLAWMFLTCPDPEYLNSRRALNLARDAAHLDKAANIMDTLAEAYFQNAMYEEAYMAARQALRRATGNTSYYRGQLAKMATYYKKFKNTIAI